jgi:hypothetical protein
MACGGASPDMAMKGTDRDNIANIKRLVIFIDDLP